jgi:hypothetical protein
MAGSGWRARRFLGRPVAPVDDVDVGRWTYGKGRDPWTDGEADDCYSISLPRQGFDRDAEVMAGVCGAQ